MSLQHLQVFVDICLNLLATNSIIAFNVFPSEIKQKDKLYIFPFLAHLLNNHCNANRLPRETAKSPFTEMLKNSAEEDPEQVDPTSNLT